MTAAGETVLETRGLGRSYGDRVALRGTNLELRGGELLAVLGANGSGKSTLLKLLGGFLRPSTGWVRVLGIDPRRRRPALMRDVRCAFAPVALYESLTAREHLRAMARLQGMAPRDARLQSARNLEQVGLANRADERVARYSFGMRQRLSLALALLPTPRVLLLDEPTEGLDPLAMLEWRGILQRLRDEAGVSTVLSSHWLSDIEGLADRLLVLREGETEFLGTPEELVGEEEWRFVEVGPEATAHARLRAAGLEWEPVPGGLRLPPDAPGLTALSATLGHLGLELHQYARRRPSLRAALLQRFRAASQARPSEETA